MKTEKTEQVLNFCCEMGRQLIQNGAEIYRVEDSINRLLTAYGYRDTEVFAIPSCVILNILDGGHNYTKSIRIRSSFINLDKLERLNSLCRRVCRDRPEPEAADPGVEPRFDPAETAARVDEQVVDTYLQDPFCTFTPTVGLYRDMLGGLQYISSEKALSRMDPNTPIYLFSGDQDPVGANGAGVRKVYGYFKDHGTRDLELKLYPGARHETLNETNRMEVYADVLDWLDRHCK